MICMPLVCLCGDLMISEVGQLGRVAFLGSGVVLLCAACGTVPQQAAEQQCIEQAQLAQHPRGWVGIGADNHGDAGIHLSIGISTGFLLRRDPDQVYAACVQGKSGMYPSRPFSALQEARM